MVRKLRSGRIIKNKLEDKSVVSQQNKQKPNLKALPAKPTAKKRKLTTDDNDIGSSIGSKVPSVKSVDKRRRNSNKVKPESKIFSQKEKKAFYECLKENGISCLNDESLLEQIFPNRSMPEIKAMIDGFSRKAQDLNRKTEESVSGIETDPNASKQPIEKWFDLIHQMVPNPSKKDDISAILIDIFDECGNDCPSNILDSEDEEEVVLKPDYRTVYDSISAALNGKYAKQMEPINAFVIVKLIEELKQLIKNDLNKKEMSFLKSGLWWQIPNQTNAQKPNEMLKAIHSQRQQQNNMDSNDGPKQNQRKNQLSDNCDEDQSYFVMNEVNTFEALKSYPKLRKITECLNPLRVPIKLMADECIRL